MRSLQNVSTSGRHILYLFFLVMPPSTAIGDDSEQGETNPLKPLIQQLQKAAGSTVSVELKNGESFLRAQLLRVNVDRKKGAIISLRIQDSDGQPRTIRFAGIRSLTLGRETVYEAASSEAKSSTEKAVQAQIELSSKERQQWIERAKMRGIAPWPKLTNEEHRAAVEDLLQLVKQVADALPGMDLYETHEFLFASNIPAEQVVQYTTALDAMHDKMCAMYGIKQGEPVWRGKCLVMAFLNKAEFMLFERNFLKISQDASGAYGRCHPYGDGRVIIACYRGDQQQEFAKMLVHETSHGFIHRYRTPVRLPSWVNEGMADWIARALVPQSRSVQQRELKAITMMRQSHSMGGDFLTRKSNIDAWQYGIASNMTDFLLNTNTVGYTRFIQGMKEGLTWIESLQAAFNCTPQEFVASYGQVIGVPDLRP
jgi:hypothetical protein